MRIVGIVPVWRRVDDLQNLLDTVAASTRPLDGLIVVDNDATPEVRAVYADRGYDVVTAATNEGAVTAFRRGLARAWELGADAVWLLDDDATVAPDALERLLAPLDSDPDIGGVAPAVHFADGRAIAGWLWEASTPRGCGHAPTTAPGEIDWAPFAGLLLTREACLAAGDLRHDLFLWHADVEYCLRIRARGFRLLAVPDAVVRHPVYPLQERRILGRRFTVRTASPWQEYEDARNWAILARVLQDGPLRMRTPLWRRAVGEALRAVAVIGADPIGVRRAAMRIRGLAEGWFGRAPRTIAGAPPAAIEAYRTPR